MSIIVKRWYIENIRLKDTNSKIYKHSEMGFEIKCNTWEIDINTNWEDNLECEVSSLWEEWDNSKIRVALFKSVYSIRWRNSNSK